MSNKLRWGVIAGALAVLTVGGWFGGRAWRGHVIAQQRQRAYAAVEAMMRQERWLEARGAVRAFWRDLGTNVPEAESTAWRRLDVATSERTGDVSRLVWLERLAPAVVAENETASLLVARTFVAAGEPEEADRVRTAWRERETHPELWLVFDADRLIAAGRTAEARALLASHPLAGEADAGRRLRLALLAPDPVAAWAELTAALTANPRHPDVRTFRAQILERVGRIEEARIEYVAALTAAPNDVVRRDQLAEFYRRRGAGALASQTWRDGLTPTAPDFLWLRMRLWERLWGRDGAPLPPPSPGAWTPLIDGLADLAADRFWSDRVLADEALARRAVTRPAVGFLRVLECLRTADEAGAMLLLGGMSETERGWDATAVAMLQVVLRWRATGVKPRDGELPGAAKGLAAHVLLEQLRAWPAGDLPVETARLLRGPDAWTALMLACGWPEAALTMAGTRLASPAPELPDWFYYGVAAALRERRSGAAALAYLAQAPTTPLLRLQAAELHWGEGDPAGRVGLAELAGMTGAVGYRAAWILATAAAEQGDPGAARAWVLGQPELAASPTGRALLARLALAEGDAAGAAAWYAQLGPDSLEAGMFLAREAFAAGRWAEARELTNALLERFPGELALRANLDKIATAEAKAAAEVRP